MRYRGGAAGHAAVRGAVDEFLSDRDLVDIRHLERRREELRNADQHREETSSEDEATQDEDDRMGWRDDMDAMDEDEDEDWGYRRELEVDKADYVPSETSDDEEFEDGRAW